MNIIKVLRQEAAKLEKESSHITHQLNSIRTAIHALNGASGASTHGAPRRKMSAAARARIAKAQRLRWAKVRQANNKTK